MARDLIVYLDGAKGTPLDIKGVNSKIGNLSNLHTTEKSNLVGAINEVDGDVLSLKNDFSTILNVKCGTFESGYYKTVAVGGAVTKGADDEMVCTIIPVSAGDKVTINASGSSGQFRLYVFIDSNGNALNLCSTNLTGIREVIAPSGAAYIAVNNYLNRQPTGFYVYAGAKPVEPEQVSYRLTDFEQGAIDSTGDDGSSSIYCRTGFILIDQILRIYKPVGMTIIVNRYNANKVFIDRDTNTSSSSALDYGQTGILAKYGGDGTAYLRFSIARYESGSQINSKPEDIVSSGLNIKIIGASNDIYDRIVADEQTSEAMMSCKLLDFVDGTVASDGSLAYSVDYCRTDYLEIDKITHIHKPADDYLMIISSFDANKTFITRFTSLGTGELDYTSDIASLFGGSNAKYLIISVTKYDSGSTPTTVDDIISGGFYIEYVKTLDSVYSRVYHDENGTLPDYYYEDDYLPDLINSINAREDVYDGDYFFFLTDYHFNKNAGNSPLLINKIAKETGISKFIFGGDAGKSSDYEYMYLSARENSEIYEMFSELPPTFYGIVGNHEWNDYQDASHEASQQPEVYSRTGIYNFYIQRFASYVKGMSAEGNYYIDDERSKIRYYFLQDTGQAKISDNTVAWLGHQLEAIPSGYYVIVVSHYAYTGGSTDSSTYGGRVNLSVLRISQLLGALKTQSTVTVNQYSNTGSTTGTYSFDYTNTNATPICIVSGHTHWDASLTTSESDYGILTIATTTDSAGYAQDAETHASTPRTVGTIEEQAFDIYQISLSQRKVYLTRVGGGEDREFTF